MNPFEIPSVVREGDVVIESPMHYAGSIDCDRCDDGHTASGAQVSSPWEDDKPVCRQCALIDPLLAPWQALADAIQAMDAAYVFARTEEGRKWFHDLLLHAAGYMADWRSDEGEHVSAEFAH